MCNNTMNAFYNVFLNEISQSLHYSSFMLRLQRELNSSNPPEFKYEPL